MTQTAEPPTEGASLEGARALVTGATGFLGRHLLARLADRGAEVCATSRRTVEEPTLTAKASWRRVDLGDPRAVETLVREVRPDVVFHLASVVKGSRDRALVVPCFEANLASTVYLLDASADSGVQRFVQIGSLEEPPLDEPPGVPASPYAAAKAAATSYGRMFAELYGLPVVVARVFMVYGPGAQDGNKLVPYVISRLLAHEEIELGDGVRLVDWIYVEDVVEGLLRLAVQPGIEGRQIDLGSGELVSIATVVEQLYSILGVAEAPPFGTLEKRSHEQVRKADRAATEAALGWSPGVTLDEGLRRTVEWFRHQRAGES